MTSIGVQTTFDLTNSNGKSDFTNVSRTSNLVGLHSAFAKIRVRMRFKGQNYVLTLLLQVHGNHDEDYGDPPRVIVVSLIVI